MKKLLFFLFFICMFLPVSADEKKVYTYEEFINAFTKETGIEQLLDARINEAAEQYAMVKAARFPEIKLTLGAAPYPGLTYETRGDIDGSDSWNYDYSLNEWGLAARLRSSIVFPIFAFGQMRHGKKAASGKVSVRKAEKELSVISLRKKAASLYYSYLMAMDIHNIMEMVTEKMDEVESKLKRWLYEEKEGVKQKDLIQLRIAKENLAYEFDRVRNDIEFLRGVFDEVLGDNWAFEDDFIKKKKYNKSSGDITNYFLYDSPYADLSKSAISARKSLYKLEFAKLFPVIGIAGQFNANYTSSVDDSGYADPLNKYNGMTGEAGLGIIFNLNILKQYRRMKKAESEWHAVKHQINFEKKRRLLEIERAGSELKSLSSKVSHTKEARKHAKGWMTMELTNYSSGFSDTSDLVKAVRTFVENEFSHISALYDYNMKVEEIKEKTGTK
ncbi:MAG: TolC family protein [bacterium]